MRKQTLWLRDACARKPALGEHTTYYAATGTELQATNGLLSAGTPFPSGVTALLPGAALEAAIKAGPDRLELAETSEPDRLLLRGSGFRAKIPCRPVDDWEIPTPQGKWWSVPAWLVPTLRDLAPFVAEDDERPWMCGVALMDGFAWATDGKALARSVEQLPGAPDVLVPRWAVDFLLAHEDGLAKWCITTNHIGFKWSDGSWMRAQLLNGAFTDAAPNILASATAQDTIPEFPEGWRDALAAAAALADETIDITVNQIRGTGPKAEVEVDTADWDVDLGVTRWPTAQVERVARVAQRWDPSHYPKPAPWVGERLLGVLVGIQGVEA